MVEDCCAWSAHMSLGMRCNVELDARQSTDVNHQSTQQQVGVHSHLTRTIWSFTVFLNLRIYFFHYLKSVTFVNK